jgi:hypothetical protein
MFEAKKSLDFTSFAGLLAEPENPDRDLSGELFGRHTAITKRRYLPTTNDVW